MPKPKINDDTLEAVVINGRKPSAPVKRVRLSELTEQERAHLLARLRRER